jgi:hypothetical protein
MDDIEQCGNDLRFLEWWLIHHGGDPRYKQVIGDLTAVTQGAVQILVSSQLTNQALGREFQSESAKAFTAAANRLGSVQAVARTA